MFLLEKRYYTKFEQNYCLARHVKHRSLGPCLWQWRETMYLFDYYLPNGYGHHYLGYRHEILRGHSTITWIGHLRLNTPNNEYVQLYYYERLHQSFSVEPYTCILHFSDFKPRTIQWAADYNSAMDTWDFGELFKFWRLEY